MGVFDIIIGLISIISFILILRNTGYRSVRNTIAQHRPKHAGDGKIIVDGKILTPVIYTGPPIPRERLDEGLPYRLAAIIRQARVNATIATTMMRINKDAALSRLERDIERARMAYEATRHVKYSEKLSVLEKLYRDIARSTAPYAGSLTLIVWLGESEPESRAEAVRSLFEAEMGVKLSKFNGSLSEALATTRDLMDNNGIAVLPWDPVRGEPIILGVHPDYGILYALSWPRDFQTHIGIIGPTGRGKTVLMALVAFQLNTKNPGGTSIVILDPKGDLERLVEKSGIEIQELEEESYSLPCYQPGAYKPAGRGKEKHENAKRLLAALLDSAEQDACTIPVVVFVDEAWRFLGELENYMESSIREGRSRGLYIIYATQTPRDIPRNILDNTGVQIIFGGYTRSYTEDSQILGLKTEDLLYLPVGTAIVKKKGEPPFKVRVFNYEEYVKKPASRSRLERSRRGVTDG